MKLRHLEMALERVAGFSNPSAEKEQYQTPAPLAARLLHHAFMQGEIEGHTVCDLGCGTGILSIGAALLGATRVIGIDSDPRAIRIAGENAEAAGVHPAFFSGDMTDEACVRRIPPCDTVVMNPPFGAQAAYADRPFIDAALRVSPVVYSIFNSGSRAFVEQYIRGRAEVVEAVSARLTIPRTFSFHSRDRLGIPVEILRIRRCKD